MPSDPPPDVTRCLQQMQAGDELARDELFEHIYTDLKDLASRLFRRQPKDQTLQPTALVNEAYLRLVGSQKQSYADRQHFLSVAALAMRQLITDHARRRGAQKRGGKLERMAFEENELVAPSEEGIDLAALDDALSELARLHERQCRIVELRFLAGLSVPETAAVLDVSPRTVRADWTMAKRFLAYRLGSPGTE